MGTLWCQAGKEERKRGENNDDPRTGRPERRENGRKRKKKLKQHARRTWPHFSGAETKPADVSATFGGPDSGKRASERKTQEHKEGKAAS